MYVQFTLQTASQHSLYDLQRWKCGNFPALKKHKSQNYFSSHHISIIYTLLVCLYPRKVETAEPIRPQICCGTSRDPKEGFWMIEFLKICLLQNSTFENFENPRLFSVKSAKFFVCFCFIMYTKRTCSQF